MNKILKNETQQFIALNNFKELTNVQKQTLDFTAGQKDVIVLAKTGTGKTHAYLIPICEMINPFSDKTQVVISLPTRELAYQVYQNARLLINVYPELRISLLTGGMDAKRHNYRKAPHIIIGTPGRIRSFFTSEQIRVDFVQMFVIDEADMTLEYGFLDDIDVVFSSMVKNPEVLCFSATFPQELQNFTRKYLDNPKIIRVDDKKRNPHISHILVPCKHKEYKEALLDVLAGINPYICLIFANSKLEADEAYAYLREHDYRVLLLHGGLDARERSRALKALNSREYTYVVASDVASRGIDIDGISHVISLGFPKELPFYIHRAGRTGRNSRDGVCYALYKESDLSAITSLAKEGISFSCKEYKRGEWRDLRSPLYKRPNRFDKEEKAIVQSLSRKKEKVKPNYKKKKTEKVNEIKRKRRRDFIRQKIKEEKIERYKAQARTKND